MEKIIQSILRDLYELDPELKKYEKDLIPLLQKLAKAKPNLKLDENFVSRLKNQLMARADELMETEMPARTNWFSRVFAPLMGGTLALAALAIGIMVWNGNEKFASKLDLGPKVIRLEERGAFGPLSMESAKEVSQATGGYTKTVRVPSKTTVSGEVAPSEPVRDESKARMMATESADVSTSVSSGVAAPSVASPMPAVGFGGGGAPSPGYSTLSVWIPYVYKYVYKGEPMTLTENTVSVYKRVTGKADDSSIVRQLSSAGFGLMDLTKLKGLSLENAMLSQETDQGYLVNIDFRGETVSLQPKWDRWQNPAMECNGDTDCLNRSQIKLSAYPGDEAVAKWAEDFFAEYKIDRSAYGEPVIQKFWEENPEAKVDVLPDEIYLAYPLLIDGQPTYDTSGAPFGLQVTANLRYQKISGVTNLMTPRFESSEYDAVTDFDAVLKYAEEGQNPWKPEGEYKTLEIELGTPEKVMTSVWLPPKNFNEQGEQVFVPALKFPIVKKPKEEPYFWQKAVIVPLAKELLERQNGPVGYPMPLIERAK